MKRKLREMRLDLERIVREPLLLVIILAIFAMLALFIVLPLVKLIFKAGASDAPIPLIQLLFKPYTIRAFVNSVHLGLWVAVLGTLVGFVFAYAVSRSDIKGKGLLRTVGTFPIISPPFVIAVSAILLFGRNGVITEGIFNKMLGINLYAMGFDIYGFWGLLIVETMAYFPTAFLVLSGILGAIDPSMEEAAESMGGGKWSTFKDVILPLSIPGIVSSMLLIFILSLADFGNPLVLSGRFSVLSVQAYLMIVGQNNLSGGAALALLLLFPSLIAFIVQKYWLEKKSFVTVTGKVSARSIRPLLPRTRAFLYVFCFGAAAVVFLFYGMVVFGSFTHTWGANNSFTLKNYIDAFQMGWDYIKDSLLLASIATPITGILGMLIAFLVTRRRFLGRGLMEFVSMLTFAAPGTVVGIGYVLAFNKQPIMLQGTALIIILLFVFRNMPMGIRSGIASLKQIDPAIEEASVDLGYSSIQTFKNVTLPLIAPAFFSGLAFSFVRCMTALSAVIFVVSGRWNLITVAVMGYVENSDLSQAAALCMILIGFVMVALGVIRFAVSRYVGGKGIEM